MESRIEGCFLGQLIGDSLGTRYEYKLHEDACSEINGDIIDNFIPILGEGPCGVGKGQVTDDSELALALARSICKNSRYDCNTVATNYIIWYNSHPVDIGKTTKLAFDSANNYDKIVENANNNNLSSLSNGCLMRVSPLAIHGLTLSDDELIQIIHNDCIMTNPNPIAIDATIVYVFAVREAIKTGDRILTYNKAIEMTQTQTIKDLLIASKNICNPVYIECYDQEFPIDSSKMGYLGMALQNAFFQLLHRNTFYDGLIETIKLGGDTDTNGCIAGSLLGALYGINNMPKQWINTVLNPEYTNNRLEKYPLGDIKDYVDIINGLLSKPKEDIN